MRLPSKRRKLATLAMRNLFSLRLGTLCLLLFLGLLLISKLYESTTYSFAAYATTPPRSENQAHSLPTFIYFPSLDLGLPIEQVTITHGVWPTHDDSVSHIANSAIPGENGNMVIYGRNRLDQFGLLTSLRKGDEVIVDMQNGNSYTYQVTELAVVLPNETSLKSGNKEILTLYTPYGVASLRRFVVRATFVENL